MFIYGTKRVNLMDDFGQYLKEVLETKGWTQGELSRRSCVSRGAISNIIKKRRLPSPESCVNFAQALNIPPETYLSIYGTTKDNELQDYHTIFSSVD